MSDEAEAAIVKDRLSDNPTVTADAIANNNALTPDARQRTMRLVERGNEPDPAAEVSGATAVDLLDRIRREDGDAKKITNIGPIVDAYGAGKLSRADFEFVDKRLDEARSPKAKTLTGNAQAFISRIKPLAERRSFGNPDGRTDDLASESRLYDLERNVYQKIDDYRRNGKDPNVLFDPSNSEYVGKPETLLPYVHGSWFQLLHDAGGTPTPSVPEQEQSPGTEAPPATAEAIDLGASEAAAARTAAAKRLRGQLFHNKQGALTESIPHLALTLAGLASGAEGPAAVIAGVARLIRLIQTFGPTLKPRIQPTAEKSETTQPAVPRPTESNPETPETTSPETLKEIESTLDRPRRNSEATQDDARNNSTLTIHEKIRQELYDRARTTLQEFDPTNPNLQSQPTSVPTHADVRRLNKEIARINKRDGLNLEPHHNLPLELKQYFDDAGLDVEDYVTYVPKAQHRLKEGNGLHTGTDSWNKQWRILRMEHPVPKLDEIHSQLYPMIQERLPPRRPQ
jgi:hypothetical protein